MNHCIKCFTSFPFSFDHFLKSLSITASCKGDIFLCCFLYLAVIVVLRVLRNTKFNYLDNRSSLTSGIIRPCVRLAAGNNCSCSIKLRFVLGVCCTLPGPRGSVATGIPVTGSVQKSNKKRTLSKHIRSKSLFYLWKKYE